MYHIRNLDEFAVGDRVSVSKTVTEADGAKIDDDGYLWLLAREPALSAPVRDDLVKRARAWGFATDELIWVQHPAPAPARASPRD